MLAIRLARVGRKKQPLYRVVVSEKTKDMYGDHLEILGTYNPHTKEAQLKDEQIKHWISKGAQPSESANNLLIKEGIIEGKKAKAVAISKKRQAKMDKAKAADKPAEETEAPAEGDAPKEEAPAEAKEEKPAEETEAPKEAEEKKE